MKKEFSILFTTCMLACSPVYTFAQVEVDDETEEALDIDDDDEEEEEEDEVTDDIDLPE